jgi:hypothetical protein
LLATAVSLLHSSCFEQIWHNINLNQAHACEYESMHFSHCKYEAYVRMKIMTNVQAITLIGKHMERKQKINMTSIYAYHPEGDLIENNSQYKKITRASRIESVLLLPLKDFMEGKLRQN